MLAIAAVAVGLGALMGLISMVAGRGRFPRVNCLNNLKGIVLALHNYHDIRGAFPSGTSPNTDVPPEKRLSWYALITTQLNYSLPSEINLAQSWDHIANDAIAGTRLPLLECPEAIPPPGRPWPTQYIGIAGVGTDAPLLPKGHPRAGVFGYDRRTAITDITDGTANTMMVAESARVRDSWLAGGPATVRGLDTAELPYIVRGRQYGGLHSSGTYAAFVDGSVRFVRDTIDPRVLEAYSTIAGGEALFPNLVDGREVVKGQRRAE